MHNHCAIIICNRYRLFFHKPFLNLIYFIYLPCLLQDAFENFQGLDERINFVATKVVHLGDQLEGVNTPRAKDAEAQLLMKYFAEFMQNGPLKSEIFTDPFQVG